MSGRRKNGEGTWGTKTIKGVQYKYYRDSTGKYFYGKTDKEINAKRKEFKESSKQNKSKDLAEIKKQCFGEYIVDWLLRLKKLDLKRNTTDGYEACINGQLLKYKHYDLSGIQVGALTLEILQDYYTSLGKHYARATIKKNFAILSQCIKYGNKRNHFSETIDLDEIKIPHEDIVAHKKKEIHFLTENDIEKFCKEAQRINTVAFNFGGKVGEPTYGNNANLLIFIIYTGIRISEGIELKWSDVDLTSNVKTITVKNNSAVVKNREEESDQYVQSSSTTKTPSGYRIISLNKKAMEIISLEESINPKHNPEDYVFITKNGGKIKSRQNVNKTLNSIMLRAGCSIPSCTPHELRHTFGSLLIKKGADIKVVSELLGHKDVSVTYNIYIHILKEQKVEAVNSLDF